MINKIKAVQTKVWAWIDKKNWGMFYNILMIIALVFCGISLIIRGAEVVGLIPDPIKQLK